MDFLSEDFLLNSQTAKKLYHDYAAKMPIFDYHCHLPPEDIAENRSFKNLTEIWLEGDHYKWRAMRANGISERFITGDASAYEKFLAWAKTVPNAIGNPLYHWTHMELKNFFGVDGKLLNSKTAKEIWTGVNDLLKTDPFRVRELIKKMNVKVICTTDDPVDNLEYHKAIQKDTDFPVKVLPAFRPDRAMAVDRPEEFNRWIHNLETVTDMEIKGYDGFLQALKKRHEYFHSLGCRISDHALEIPYAEDYLESDVIYIFHKVRSGKALDTKEVYMFKSAILYELGIMYWEKKWTMQLHMGALRNTNSRYQQIIGTDTGFDAIGDFQIAAPLAKFLDRLDVNEKLPKTILYVSNSIHNAIVATVAGCFQDGSIPGKVQFGSAWWYNDQKDGIVDHLKTLSTIGLLSNFVGMLTDSRSFLSYPRHEYFRRLLCNFLGEYIESGELPWEESVMGKLVQDICYNNAVQYFGIPVK